MENGCAWLQQAWRRQQDALCGRTGGPKKAGLGAGRGLAVLRFEHGKQGKLVVIIAGGLVSRSRLVPGREAQEEALSCEAVCA